MGRSRIFIMGILQFLVILFLTILYLTAVICGKSIDKYLNIGEEERWVENEMNNDMDYMGDSPVGISLNPNDDSLSDGCSPLPDVLITDACAAQQCKFHGDCGNENERCCSNGCVKTCLKQREPPPYIDWVKEPRRRTSSGVSWLVNGPNSNEDLELCSTTPVGKDEDPLLCPHGYVCHVIKRGSKKKGIPNIGHCIPEKDNEFVIEKIEEKKNINKMKILSSCLVDKYVLLNGAFLYLRGQKCVCKEGFLTCLDKKT